MAWQVSDYALRKWYCVDRLTPKQIGEKFKDNPMPEDLVVELLRQIGIESTPSQEGRE